MFEYIDRNQTDSLVLVTGWAFDSRIFEILDLPFNYFLFTEPLAKNFTAGLGKLLKKKCINSISILGWSQGAFAASEFAAANPEKVKKLILIGARRRYDRVNLENIKVLLNKSKKAFLYKLYRQCFCDSEQKEYTWFKDTLMKDYLDIMSLSVLEENLDYLSDANLNLEALKNIKDITIIHGREDAVADIDEAIEIRKSLPSSEFIIMEKTGHLPFLKEGFAEYLDEC